ncbi:unnamed protein product [Paramecium octaurelia]|uniref:Uncharacterized protein n=1 Tax=Paramecium octaurelia TaxID=43137 RepID=A0A8S1UU83_PAROT|nr:unnamed protein product [Paramecium octaurelia]
MEENIKKLLSIQQELTQRMQITMIVRKLKNLCYNFVFQQKINNSKSS